MAGIQFKGGKCHGAGEAKAMMRHACADERVRHGHSNVDIDTKKTAQNSDLHGLDYGQMCRAYDQKIRQYNFLNHGRRLRKDAVTLYDAIITVPKDLPQEQQGAWFCDVEQTINKHYGADVVLDIKIHRDEIHDYVDPDTKQTVTSRVHGHCFMFPMVDGRFNAKQFSSRRNMQILNREIDAMSRERYQCRFMTGEKAVDRSFQTVEQRKRASDAAQLEQRIKETQARAEDVARQRDALEDEVDALRMEHTVYSAAQVSEAEKQAKSPLFRRDKVILPRSTYEELIQTAHAAQAAKEQARGYILARRSYENEINSLLEEAQQTLDRAREKERTVDFDRAMELADAKYQLDGYKRLETTFPGEFKQLRRELSQIEHKQHKRDYSRDMPEQ